jgi:hypothetical protein
MCFALSEKKRVRERSRETFRERRRYIYIYRERERERPLIILNYEVILGNCNGALYIYIIYFHIFLPKCWGSISIPRRCHMLYTLYAQRRTKTFEHMSQESNGNKMHDKNIKS